MKFAANPALSAAVSEQKLTSIMQELAEQSNTHEMIGVLCVQIQHEQKLIDTYGTSFRDILFDHAACVVRASVRFSDQVAAGENLQLIVFSRCCDDELMQDLANRLMQRISTTPVLYNNSVIGIAAKVACCLVRGGNLQEIVIGARKTKEAISSKKSTYSQDPIIV
ncbi:MAG: GGDEF domain-containing protein [Planctomycetales bacterium]|nr:GGDEF domain-containing protein [Planctomycetales bacterium]